ncbi:hypothetical protein GMRT_12741 [Giardia muris]|uniref:Uncharacterized protein n=1 Tax=Giardia muris TaxID=5742 RepID=A0A4Z1T614_GIAMU|nr:hypothetical protein GMRT_12741 [Giardia muris]|eukprot:TNJ28577.1 hypothetical protein GMRT_12741 [Giardia muris]
MSSCSRKHVGHLTMEDRVFLGRRAVGLVDISILENSEKIQRVCIGAHEEPHKTTQEALRRAKERVGQLSLRLEERERQRERLSQQLLERQERARKNREDAYNAKKVHLAERLQAQQKQEILFQEVRRLEELERRAQRLLQEQHRERVLEERVEKDTRQREQGLSHLKVLCDRFRLLNAYGR